jgi:hypothetical protein
MDGLGVEAGEGDGAVAQAAREAQAAIVGKGAESRWCTAEGRRL